MKKWIIYKIIPNVDRRHYDVLYYTRRGSSLSHTDPEHWSPRIGQAHIFQCPESEMQHYQEVKARYGCNTEYREIEDSEIFIERLRG